MIPQLLYLFRYSFSYYFLFHTGLKAMVSQGVKNPLIDLTALEDKTLDEVSMWGEKTENKQKIWKKTIPLP